MKKYDAIIIGGGLAGLSSAYYLSQKDKKILLLEQKPFVGGRTASWIDKNGMQMESGLHRMLGFYEEMPALMEACSIDIDNAIIWEDELEIRLADGTKADFGMSLMNPIQSISSALGNNDFLNPADKLKLMAFFTQGFIDLKNKSSDMDTMSLEDYALKNDVSDKIIFRILTPLTEGLFFIPPHKYSAYNFFALFEPYLTKLHKTRAGAFSGGMTEVLTGSIAKKIQKHGSDVLTNASVDEILHDNGNVTGVVVKGEKYIADAVILAAGIKAASHVLTRSNVHHTFSNLPTMPSVTVQFELTEPSLPKDRVTFSPGTLFASYSEQSRTTFKGTKGRLSVIIAQADKYLKTKPETIIQKLIEDAKSVDINLTRENIIRYQIVTWEHDFYSYACGNKDNIPAQATSINGLYLAGDYTDQKYMQTMEGAVYSGRLAAEYIT